MNSRRGGAMLLVLMASTVMIVGVSTLARAQSSSALAAIQASRLRLCHHLIAAAEEPTLYWLNERSGGVVTDPDQATPMVGVLDTQLDIDQAQVRIQITAWDQHGMWPRNCDALGISAAPMEEVSSSQSGVSERGAGAQIYPTSRYPISRKSIRSTHNPWPTQSGRTRRGAYAAINVNTSPRELLEQLSALHGTGGLDELFERRSRGEFVTISQSTRGVNGGDVRLVSMSHCWAFRTQVTVDGVTRGIWSVYANRGGYWERVQREVIHESLY
ncbi:MAG: hypothetical protein ACF8LL_00660 [Phycisphaerales bacterium]